MKYSPFMKQGKFSILPKLRALIGKYNMYNAKSSRLSVIIITLSGIVAHFAG